MKMTHERIRLELEQKNTSKHICRMLEKFWIENGGTGWDGCLCGKFERLEFLRKFVRWYNLKFNENGETKD